MCGSLLGGDADPLQTDDEEDLREDQIADRELFAKCGAVRLDGGFAVPGRR